LHHRKYGLKYWKSILKLLHTNAKIHQKERAK